MHDLTITGVSHLELHVADADASAAWYESAVGLTPSRAFPGTLAVLESPAGGFRLVLRPDRPVDAHGEFGHVALRVESLAVLQAWAERLEEIGEPHQGIKETPTGHAIDLIDPDGYQVELTCEQ